MKRFIAILVIFCAACGAAIAQKKKTPVKPPRGILTIQGTSDAPTLAAPKLSPDAERRLNTFLLVWNTIRDNYFDQTFSGLDWNKIRFEYEPQVLKTTTDVQLHGILQEMINRLNRSHFAIIPPDVYREIQKVKENAGKEGKPPKTGDEEEMPDDEIVEDVSEDLSSYQYGIGIDLRLIKDQFVITRVDAGSAGEKAGLKPGFVIEKINDFSLKEIIERFQTMIGAKQSYKKMLPLEVTAWLLNGVQDTSVSLTFLDEKEQVKQIDIKREKLSGKMISIGGNFPSQYLSFETKSLNADVGYIRFNLFAVTTVAQFCAALTELKDKKAIVIDLRGNIGGLIGAIYGVSGMLTDKSMELGTQISRTGSDKMTVSPKAKNYKGRLVFLTDSLSISSAEVFAAAMQENNRALIVGDRSAGEALPSVSILLPTGAVMLYPIANFKTPNGNFIEGKGVTPNFEVALDRKALLEGRDNQLETALKVIKEDTAFSKPAEKSVVLATVNVETEVPTVKVPPKRLNVATIPTGIPNEPKTTEEKDTKDEKSLQVIADFIKTIGGEEELKKIEAYHLTGIVETALKGMGLSAEISIYRQKPSKYVIILKSEGLGEFREIYTDKLALVQSDFGMETPLLFTPDTSRIEMLAPIFKLLDKDFFKSMKYLGTFESDGRKMHIVESKISEYLTTTMTFDVETKMLVSYITPLSTVYLNDYRKVENIMLPFSISQSPGTIYSIGKISLNPKIDESVFAKKENCFDRPN